MAKIRRKCVNKLFVKNYPLYTFPSPVGEGKVFYFSLQQFRKIIYLPNAAEIGFCMAIWILPRLFVSV
jgi:hypothetical protein